jgi:hypothetical protein
LEVLRRCISVSYVLRLAQSTDTGSAWVVLWFFKYRLTSVLGAFMGLGINMISIIVAKISKNTKLIRP